MSKNILKFKTKEEAEKSPEFKTGEYFRFYEITCERYKGFCIDIIDLGSCVNGQHLIKIGNLL